MNPLDPNRGPAREESAVRTSFSKRRPTPLDQIGGPIGFVYSAAPVAVFVAANTFLPLNTTIIVSVAVGLSIAGYRLLRGEKFSLAAGGLLGLALAIGVVSLTGSARDFFVIGIWAYLAAFVLTLGSVLLRRPLTGIAWNLVHGGRNAWRADSHVLRAHDIATLAVAAMSGVRFAVQQWLYVSEETGWLGVARIAMGWPLTILAALVVVWAWRRSTRLLSATRA